MRTTPKILFIDDDRFFLEFYRAELSQFNITTDFASDGEEGLQKAKEQKPDVILLDVILPKKDGFEVLTELKANPETKDIPVIIISTLNASKDIDELLRLGAAQTFNKLTSLPKDVAAYVRKSFTTETFEQADAPVAKKAGATLAREQIHQLLKGSLDKIEHSLAKLFSKKAKLDDINVSLIALADFKKHIKEMAKGYGTIFIYSEIDAKTPGAVLLSLKRDAALSLIKLIERGVVGKELGLTLSDQVVEEFFNIVVNAFLTELSKSVPGQLVLRSPIISNPSMIESRVAKSGLAQKDQLVAFLEESYRIEELDINFSLYVSFGSGLFVKK